MPNFRFSHRAEADLRDIVQYSLRTWGDDQAIRYIESLEACCENLAAHPTLGRACDEIRPGLYRLEQGRHVIFYRREAGGILVSRILHQRMLPWRHVIDEEADGKPE